MLTEHGQVIVTRALLLIVGQTLGQTVQSLDDQITGRQRQRDFALVDLDFIISNTLPVPNW